MTLLNVESEYKNFENEDFWKRYKNYLKEGSVEVCPISQIIIVGEQGVGKTTLLYRLQGKTEEEIKAIRSTRGVECHRLHQSFVITENQLKMNKKGISSLTADPYQISAFSAERKNDAEESPERTTQRSYIQPAQSNTREEQAEKENDDKATFSDTEKEKRQENGSLSALIKKEVHKPDSTNRLQDHKRQPNDDILSKHAEQPDHNRQTNLAKEQSLILILMRTLEKRSILISQLGNKDDVVLDVLDFAGQGEYYATHQTHIRKDAIFIVVMNSSKDVNRKAEIYKNGERKNINVANCQYLSDRPGVSFNCWSPKDYLHYWLNTIRMHGGNNSNVIFVATHQDQKREDFDFGKLLDDSRKLKLVPEEYYKPVITDLIRFDNEIENDLSKIKSYICKIIMKHKRESRPAKWVKYLNTFNIIREKIPIIKIEDVLKIVDEFDFEMSDTEVADMLKFFHCSGKIIFFNMFNEEKLNDNLILDIQWFIDCFKYIISNRKHVDEDCEIIDSKEKEKLNYYHKTGVLDMCVYEKLLKQENIPEQYWETLGEYQSKLGMMFCIMNYQVDDSVAIEKVWYVPSINTQEFKPNEVYKNKDSSPILCFRFTDYMPHDLFGRVIVACLNSGHWHPFDYRLCKAGADMCYQHSSIDEKNQIYLFTSERIITVQFIGKNAMEEGKTVRKEIDSILRRLCKFYASSTEYEVGFLCQREEGYKENSADHFISAKNKYCHGCPERFLDKWTEAESFWKDVSDEEHPGTTNKEMDSFQKACEIYFHVVIRSTGVTDNIRRPEEVGSESNNQWLDDLVDIEQELKDMHRTTNVPSNEKENKLRNINKNLKKVSLDLKYDCRDLRKEIFFLTTQNTDVPRKRLGFPVVSLECANGMVHLWSNVILEAKTYAGIFHHLWIRKTFLDNKYQFLHPDYQEEKFKFQETNAYPVLMIENFDAKDEGQYYVVIETENGFTVSRKTVTLFTDTEEIPMSSSFSEELEYNSKKKNCTTPTSPNSSEKLISMFETKIFSEVKSNPMPVGETIQKTENYPRKEVLRPERSACHFQEEMYGRQCSEKGEDEWSIVVALDFGTTYSGFAFLRKENPSEIHPGKWKTNNTDVVESNKTPTCLLLNKNNELIGFGFEAERIFKELLEDELDSDYRFFSKFKMCLHQKKTFDKEMEIADHLGHSAKAIDVFSIAIRFLKVKCLQLLEEKNMMVPDDKIRWILTVPAIWDESAKQFMRKAAEQAEIPSEQLKLALEPEAAAICVIKDSNQVLGAESITTYEPGAKIILADLGGGTADIIVMELMEDRKMKQLYRATGGAWGGNMVNEQIWKMLENIFGRDVIKEFKKQRADYMEMESNIELKKRDLTLGSRLLLPIFPSFADLCKSLKGKTYRNLVMESPFADIVKVRTSKLIFEPKMVERIFDLTLSHLFTSVDKIIGCPNTHGVKDIVLAGGFSQSEIIVKQFEKRLRRYKIIIPTDPGLAVLKGAVMFGQNINIITSRISPHTYGFDAMTYFMPGNPQNKRKKIEGTYYCIDIFDKMVSIGESVDFGKTVEKEVFVTSYEMTKMVFKFYQSNEENPQFITDKGCECIGELLVDMPDVIGGKDRSVLVSIKFGETEIVTSGVDGTTGKRQETKLNLLGKKY